MKRARLTRRLRLRLMTRAHKVYGFPFALAPEVCGPAVATIANIHDALAYVAMGPDDPLVAVPAPKWSMCATA